MATKKTGPAGVAHEPQTTGWKATGGNTTQKTLTIDEDLTASTVNDGLVTNGDSHDHSGGDGAQIAYSTLSGLPTIPSGSSVTLSVHQVAHGLSINNLVKLTAGTYSKAQADVAANSAVVGIVSAVAGEDDFTLLMEGRFTSTAHGLTVDNIYYLSAASAGALTATEPSTAGQVSKPQVYVVDANTLYYHNWRGMVVGGSSGSTESVGSQLYMYSIMGSL